jgi:ABC-type transporter Mla subunit MlaD
MRPVRAADALSRHPLALGALVLALGGFLLVVGFLATTGPPFQASYRVQVGVPADAPVLRPGQAVRVGGRLAGLISDVEPDRAHGGSVVTANITKPGFKPLPADTRAYVRVHSIVYETYLELRPGAAKADLADGDRLRARADSGVDLLEVVQLFDRQTRESLKRTAVGVGYGLAGRGAEVNQALADTPELARDMARQLGAVTRDEGALGRVIDGAASTSAAARGTRSDDVAALVGSAGATLGALGRRRADVARTIGELPGFQDQLLATAPQAEPLLDDVAALAREARPAARSLNRTLPVVNRVLAGGAVLRTATDRIADVADPVLRGGRPVAFGLYPTMTTLGPLNADLTTLLSRIGPYRREYRIPGQPGVHKGSGEIAESGRRFIDATDDSFPGGLAQGAPAWRVLPVLTARPCQNPFPKPGDADHDTMAGDACRPGGRP